MGRIIFNHGRGFEQVFAPYPISLMHSTSCSLSFRWRTKRSICSALSSKASAVGPRLCSTFAPATYVCGGIVHTAFVGLMMECVSNVRFLISCQPSIRCGVKELHLRYNSCYSFNNRCRVEQLHWCIYALHAGSYSTQLRSYGSQLRLFTYHALMFVVYGSCLHIMH